MKTRKVYLLKDEAFTAAQTKTVDINVKDPVSSIDIIVRMTNGAAMTEASSVKPHDEFTKIEIVDGSDIIVSASMKQLQALNVLELGVLPSMELTLESGAVQCEQCTIHFGVGKNDKEHYLLAGDFKNLQIKITNTLTTPAATAWAASGHMLSVVANVIEEGAEAAKGFLMTKEIYAHTAVDGGIETIDLPRDYPYRLIMIEAFKTANPPILTVEKIKLTCDADKYIPYDIDSRDLVLENRAMFGMFTQGLKKRIAGAGVIKVDLYDLVKAAVSQDTSLSDASVLSIAGEVITVEVVAHAPTANALSTVEGVCYAVAFGHALHSVLYLPFGSLRNSAEWFDASAWGDIKLKVTGESALGAVKTVLQQLRA